MFSKSSTVMAALFAAICMFASSGAQAQTTANANFNVTATIIASCSISATDLAFGNYDPLSLTPTDQTTTIAVTCTNGAPYTVTLNGGLSGNVAARTMDDDTTGTSFLNYNLFTDAPGGTVWGDTGPAGVAGTGTGSNQNITVHGRIPAGQTTPVMDSYTDTIQATITY
ncbi:MAG: hypothetical protein RLZ98_3387 [Pseudomonadota bacterium]|jgi:spore coat protein U-like protein